MFAAITAITCSAGLALGWLPQEKQNGTSHRCLLSAGEKIRGVNLGSQFVIEPWMASDEWSSMGCGGTQSEADCVAQLGQDQANAAFAQHWSSWTTKDDIDLMKDYGLNTVRIPVGYWIYEDLVASGEHFPQGGLTYLTQICGWASDAGFYIIIDLHGAPGAQAADQPWTGQFVSSPGFYASGEYERAYEFLEWMTELVHTDVAYSNVGMLEILNEPVRGSNPQTDSMNEQYYPTAWQRIRARENSLNVSIGIRLHIQMMNTKWGSGNPHQYLADTEFAAYDDHRYLKYSTDAGSTPASYLNASCGDDRSGDTPTIVAEWSISVATDLQFDSDFAPESHVSWYRKWFAAQVIAYEKVEGWVFWSWKADKIGGVNDWRWSYQAAVTASAIPQNLGDAVNSNPCSGT